MVTFQRKMDTQLSKFKLRAAIKALSRIRIAKDRAAFLRNEI